jgi:hypothetical protein
MKVYFLKYCNFLDYLIGLWLEVNRWILRFWLVGVHILVIYILIDSLI